MADGDAGTPRRRPDGEPQRRAEVHRVPFDPARTGGCWKLLGQAPGGLLSRLAPGGHG